MQRLERQFNVIDGEVTVHVCFVEALGAVKTLLDGNFMTADEIQYMTGVDDDRAHEMKELFNFLRWVLAD